MSVKEKLYYKFPRIYKIMAILAVFFRDCWYMGHKNKEIEKFKDCHKGERCFIIATGPSLKLEDVNKLKGEYTFGVNSIINIFPETNWRPTYYCLGDIDVYKGLEKKLKKEMPDICFFPRREIKCDFGHIYWYNPVMCLFKCRKLNCVKDVHKRKLYTWLSDCARGVGSGETIVYTVLQLAAYMGFSEIYLLGTDCDYSDCNNSHAAMLEYAYKPKRNTKLGDFMISDYIIAKKKLERKDIKVYNATRGGKLEVFVRVNLDEVLQN